MPSDVKQFPIIPALNNHFVMHNFIGLADGTYAMSSDKTGMVRHTLPQGFLISFSLQKGFIISKVRELLLGQKTGTFRDYHPVQSAGL